MKIFEIKTTNAHIIKTLIEALKDILTETTFVISKDGIRIVDLDTNQIILVRMHLLSSEFEEYEVNEEIEIGVEMMTLHKIVKHITNNDSLILSMDDSNRSQLNIRIDNSKKGSKSMSRMKLSDLDYTEYEMVENVEYSSIITLPSNEFQTICRNMKDNSSKMVITKVQNELQFSSDSDMIDSEITYPINVFNESNKQQIYYLKNNKKEDIFRGIFAIEPLLSFTKCTSLCNFVELYLKNDHPLIVKYSVASLGTIRLCLAQALSK
jgi:proliferating cell nuclear antigen